MKTRRLLFFVAALLLVAAGWVQIPNWRERKPILRTIAAMHDALKAGDLDGYAALIAPGSRAQQGDRGSMGRIQTFIGPRENSPSINVRGHSATITPEREYHFGIIPGGHALELRKVDGQWYFTGRVFVD